MRRPRAVRRLSVLLLAAGCVVVAYAEGRRHPAFEVEVVKLVECPPHLRAPASEILSPLLGRTFFEVRAQADRVAERLTVLPEVAAAQIECHPPNVVEVRLRPRIPALAVKAGARWLSVDLDGVVVRATARPEAGLPQVYGLALTAEPGARIDGALPRAAARCIAIGRRVFGQTPPAVAIEPGGGMILRTADGGRAVVGDETDLERKLAVFAALRARLGGRAAYIDVSDPAAPFWLPDR